jgi:hypothetical protein
MGVSVGTKKASSSSAALVVDISDPKQVDGLAIRLLAYARWYARLRTWWLRDAGALAKGNTIEDVVRYAMISLFGDVDPDAEVKRRWDPIKYPDPFVYLMCFVKTELNNLSVSKENRRSKRGVDDDALITTDTAEALLLEAEEHPPHEARIQRLYELLIDEIGDDERLVKLHDQMMDGTLKPQVLADRLCMSVKDVYNLKKRMRNAADRALRRLEKEVTHD